MRVKQSRDRIPAHLKPYIVEQSEDAYTAIEHASWRLIMRVARDFFKDHAHEIYLEGLIETGVDSERIPRIEDMDLCLSQFGWGAVPISGFIPPSVFLELLSMGIMPIAAEMRTLAHIDYTPAPDIVHEAAGHAPIVADPDYARFLHDCGEMAKRCIMTKKDVDVYNAIKKLSDLKENPLATKEQIDASLEELKVVSKNNSIVSEATKLSRFIWWTVEYGLVGPMDSPKIYGAGLLSSVFESFHCLSQNVKKIPLTLDCINQNYDITEPQPQLFVTPDFSTLSVVAEQLAATFAYRKGGMFGLERALEAEATTTTVLDSGLQISGQLTRVDGNAEYLQFAGPVQLSYQDRELAGHGVQTHAHGFGTPLGRLKATGRAPSLLTEEERESLGCIKGRAAELVFTSGVKVQGTFQSAIFALTGEMMLMSFTNCTVTSAGGKILFDPAWGVFDMACGDQVVSVFGGAADRPLYLTDLPEQQTVRPMGAAVLKDEDFELAAVYGQIRELRESFISLSESKQVAGGESVPHWGKLRSDCNRALAEMCATLDSKYPHDWLSRLEILELQKTVGITDPVRSQNLLSQLKLIGEQKASTQELIERGLIAFGIH